MGLGLCWCFFRFCFFFFFLVNEMSIVQMLQQTDDVCVDDDKCDVLVLLLSYIVNVCM